MKRVFIYGLTRIGEEESLKAQIRQCQKYAKTNELRVVDIFQDQVAFSRQSMEVCDSELDRRENFKQLLGRLHQIDAILVSDISKLWSIEPVSYVLINRILKQNKKEVIIVNEPDYSLYNQKKDESLFSGYFRLLDEYEKLTVAIRNFSEEI